MKLTDYFQLIFEGGGLGKPYGAEKIRREDIETTVDFFIETFKETTGIDLERSKVSILGSANYKDESGDVDIAVSRNKSRELVQYLIDELQKSPKRDLFINNVKKKNPTADDSVILPIAALNFGRSVGSPFNLQTRGIKLLTTIEQFNLEDEMPGLIPFVSNVRKADGTFDTKKVQIDLNFGDTEWMKFAYHSEIETSPNPEKVLKGLHRNLILASLVESFGGSFDYHKGFKISKRDKSYNTKKEDLINFLSKKIGKKIKESDLSKYFSILNIVKGLNEKKRKFIYDTLIEKLNGPLVPDEAFIPSRTDFDLKETK